MVGDKNNQRVGIRILAVLFDGREFLVIRSAAEKILHPAHEEDLKRRHQRRRAGAIKNFGQVVFGKIELENAEVAQFGGNQMLQNRIAKALAKKGFVADEHVCRAQLAGLKLADKTLGIGESSH